MSKSFSICPECHDECLDDCFDSQLGICPACIREMKRKADAYPRLVRCLKALSDTGMIDFCKIDDLLKELGELE